jgi:hypothetical protein
MKTMMAIVLGLLATPAAASSASSADPNAPTPKLANGKPDLTGSWQSVAAASGSGGNMFRRCTPFQTKECMEDESERTGVHVVHTADERQPLYNPSTGTRSSSSSVDEQVRPGDDLPAARHPVGTAGANLPHRHRITMLYRAGLMALADTRSIA